MNPRQVASDVAAAAIALILGAGYSYLWIFVGGCFLGAGHGPNFVMRLVEAPYGLGPFLWPALFVLALFARRGGLWLLGSGLLVSHYISIGIVTSQSEWSLERLRMGQECFRLLEFAVIVHIFINIALWVRLFLGARSHSTRAAPSQVGKA